MQHWQAGNIVDNVSEEYIRVAKGVMGDNIIRRNQWTNKTDLGK